MSPNTLSSRIRLRDLSQKLWGRVSGDPRHPDNALDADWLGGYFLGCHTANESGFDVFAEWRIRGKPDNLVREGAKTHQQEGARRWRSWKAGYWAGRYFRI